MYGLFFVVVAVIGFIVSRPEWGFGPGEDRIEIVIINKCPACVASQNHLVGHTVMPNEERDGLMVLFSRILLNVLLFDSRSGWRAQGKGAWKHFGEGLHL